MNFFVVNKFKNQNIANVVEEIQKFFEKLNIYNRDKIKICFLFKESLICCQEKFGKNYDFEFVKKNGLVRRKLLLKFLSKLTTLLR